MTETPQQAHQRGRDEVTAVVERALREHERATPPPTWVAEIREALADTDGAVARIKSEARAEAAREGAAYHFSAFEVNPETPSGEGVPGLPAAIVEQLIQFYGNPPGPLAPRTGEILERGPYQSVVSRFVSQGWKVWDMTDEQYNGGRDLVLEDADFRVGVTLSLVGPYATISAGRLDNIYQPWLQVTRDNAVPEAVGRVRETLIEEGFTFLDEELLAQRVHLYTDPAEPNLLLMMGGTCGSLYGYLFCENPDDYEPDECAVD